MAEKITLPTAAEAMAIAVNRVARKHTTTKLDSSQNMAVVLLLLEGDEDST